jgi:hypothetical protein
MKRFLCVLDAPANHQNMRLMEAWSRSEGGDAKWNPLNSTMRLSGSYSWTEEKNYNTTGVCNYRYGIAGICANALTLNQRDYQGVPMYPGILKDLKAGTKTAEQILKDNEKEFDLWGTGIDLPLEVLQGIP